MNDSDRDATTTTEDAAAIVEAEYLLPHCKCGTNRDDKHSVGESEYSLLGTLYLVWGGTSTPTRIKFRCILCQRYFEESSSPSLCREYRDRS